MTDDLFERFHIEPGERNPVRAAQREMRRSLPRRFYTEAAVAVADGGFILELDGKGARTPHRRPILLPTRAAGEAVAAEWAAQAGHIDPATMPMTRIVNSALDGVAAEMALVRAEIVKFAATDLICYRAAEPASLVEREAAAWDPVLAWARDGLRAPFVVASGIAFAAQPESTIAAVADAVGALGHPIALACLHTMTTLTGSALLALAVVRQFLTPAEAWSAAHVDEDFQIRTWGEDDEASMRRAGRWREMQAAARLYAMLA